MCSRDVRDTAVCSRDGRDTVVCSRDGRDTVVCSSDAQETFRPHSCCSEDYSLTSAPKSGSGRKQSNLNDRDMKNRTEQISYW
jgi:hypothetical protein